MTNFTLESEAFDPGGVIPRKYGYKNGNNSPPLRISGVPENTASLYLIMDDPDAMGAVGKVWVHWILWNIPPDVVELQENSLPLNCLEGKTDFGEIGYGGPAPPDKEHTYVFKLYALDKKLEISNNSTTQEIEEAIKDHIIAETRLEGKYAP
ncbi:MAG: YbhB/YbcL family Raf kinase inhibitor-like protein [Nitrosopumilus sp.]